MMVEKTVHGSRYLVRQSWTQEQAEIAGLAVASFIFLLRNGKATWDYFADAIAAYSTDPKAQEVATVLRTL